MNITSVNNFNNNPYNAPSFKSVMLARVYVNGKPSVDIKTVKRGLHLATDVLFKESSDNLSREAKRCFSSFVSDYEDPAGQGAKSHFFRTRARNGKSYFFAGEHAGILDNIGIEKGKAMNRGIKEYGTSKTYEAANRGKDFIAKRIEYASDDDQFLLKHEGKNIDFCIFLKSDGVPGKRGFKLNLDRVSFRWSPKKTPIVNNLSVSASANPAPIATQNVKVPAIPLASNHVPTTAPAKRVRVPREPNKDSQGLFSFAQT